ncbi:hypothetical protein ACUXQ2_005489 [Cupriavidus metallidurans]
MDADDTCGLRPRPRDPRPGGTRGGPENLLYRGGHGASLWFAAPALDHLKKRLLRYKNQWRHFIVCDAALFSVLDNLSYQDT